MIHIKPKVYLDDYESEPYEYDYLSNFLKALTTKKVRENEV